ncbi:MAG: IS30 family transposase [Pseudomonadales bacterium]|nr:IS30 family transposase [Pseudomonadales bacterium]
MKKYNQITKDERYQIQAELKAGFSALDIANGLKRDKSSIYREINRNSGLRGYRPEQAESKALTRRKEAAKAIKMTPVFIDKIDDLIRLEWSPEQISGRLLKDNEYISHERIYQHIWADKQQGGDLHTHLRRQGKKYDKRRNGKSTRGQIKNQISIDKRPTVVDKKTRVGDWEIDTVIGKGHKGAIVTIVERKTLFTVARLVDSKQADVVTAATIQLLTPLIGRVHSITADNGKEFAWHERFAEALNTKVYFAHPYSSWERGLNENTNGLLRQYFPKGTDFRKLSQEDIDEAVYKINNRPRKTLEYKTAAEMMDRSLSKMAA